jgi:hypothetical protein
MVARRAKDEVQVIVGGRPRLELLVAGVPHLLEQQVLVAVVEVAGILNLRPVLRIMGRTARWQPTRQQRVHEVAVVLREVLRELIARGPGSAHWAEVAVALATTLPSSIL